VVGGRVLLDYELGNQTVAHKNHKHCQNCGAHFATQKELERHCLAVHEQKIVAGARSDAVPVADKAPSPRKNKVFTRSPRE